MLYTPRILLLVQLLVVVGGIWWCKEIFERLRSDIDDVRHSDERIKKGVIIFYWILTIPVLPLTVFAGWFFIKSIIKAIASLI